MDLRDTETLHSSVSRLKSLTLEDLCVSCCGPNTFLTIEEELNSVQLVLLDVQNQTSNDLTEVCIDFHFIMRPNAVEGNNMENTADDVTKFTYVS
jgi:hypothetical protein